MKRHYIAALLAITGLASCEKEITVNVPEYTPLLVVNSDTEVGDTMRVSVGKSISILKFKNGQDLSVRDAQVLLLKSGKIVDTMKYDAMLNDYNSKTIAEDGGMYEVRVNAPGYKEASASTIVPSFVKIESIQRIAKARLDMDGMPQDELRITFKDPASAGDFYILSFTKDNTSGDTSMFYSSCINTVDASIESVSNEQIDQNTCLNGNAIFIRDALFNGTTKELRVFINSAYLEPYSYGGTVYRVIAALQHVTEDYFKFRKSYQFAIENGDNPFSEPTNVFTNVKNGYGVFSVLSYDAAEVK